MRLQIVQDALKKKNIKYEYTEIDGCGSLDFLVSRIEIPCVGV